tara:strand:- start:2389 stop:2586 length:198 start_codon:yes stop_codon:yes gene_type:complete
MPKFKIEVQRVYSEYSTHTLEIEAESAEEAEELALEKTGENDHEIDWEHCSDQIETSIGDVQEVN